MVSPAPALRMAAGAVLLLLLLPSASAQAPTLPSDPRQAYFRFTITCSETFVSVDFLGSGDGHCTAMDLTYDSPGVPGSVSLGAVPHYLSLRAVPVGAPNETAGWQAYPSVSFIQLYGLSSAVFFVHVTTLPTIQSSFFRFDVLANYTAEDGSTQNATVHFVAQVRPYGQTFVQTAPQDITKKAGQNERVTYSVLVTNNGVYHDYYHIAVRSNDPDFLVAQPGGVYVPPHETRNVTFTILTPKGKLYELGRSAQFTADITPTFGGGRYQAFGFLRVTGAYVPTYWIPMALVALVSGMVVTRRTREVAQARRLERGAPRRVEPTPRQAVLLAELKRTDPEAYKERKAALDALYAGRRSEYRMTAKERRAADRAEARQARAEFKAERRRRKAEAKERRTQEARERKERKIAEAAEAKERKRKEKDLAKARKILEKKRGKLGRKEAKAAKKQAKIDAKQAKADAKAAKKAQKAAAKEAKAAARAAKKGEKP